jgi:hypothetical protein
MNRPNPFPALRTSIEEAHGTVNARRIEGEILTQSEYDGIGDRFEAWYQGTAYDLGLLYCSGEVETWFRAGSLYLAGSDNPPGIFSTLKDRLGVLNELLALLTSEV